MIKPTYDLVRFLTKLRVLTNDQFVNIQLSEPFPQLEDGRETFAPFALAPEMTYEELYDER